VIRLHIPQIIDDEHDKYTIRAQARKFRKRESFQSMKKGFEAPTRGLAPLPQERCALVDKRWTGE
jgi:hypothetical protein